MQHGGWWGRGAPDLLPDGPSGAGHRGADDFAGSPSSLSFDCFMSPSQLTKVGDSKFNP